MAPCLLLVNAVGCSAEELLTLGEKPHASTGAESTSTDPSTTMSETTASDSSRLETSSGESSSGEPSSVPSSSSREPVVVDAGTQDQNSSASEDAGDDAGDATDASVPAFAFDTPVLVTELFSGSKDDNPTLTSDMREIYFSSKRDAEDTNLWWAKRASIDEPFSEPELLVDLSSSGFDTSPAVDGNGLTFWFSSRSADGGVGELDIYRTRRASRSAAWGASELVVDLNSESDDIPRPTGAGGLIMPLASRREGDSYQTYFATRPSLNAPFATAQLVPEIHEDGMSSADAFLSLDGLTLLYAVSGDGQPGDIYVATRDSLDEVFSGITPLSELNTEADERDPWLSPDGQTLFFASDREGTLSIYRADRR